MESLVRYQALSNARLWWNYISGGNLEQKESRRAYEATSYEGYLRRFVHHLLDPEDLE